SKMLAQAENLLDDKDWDDALELFLEIIERDPDYAEAYIGAAKAYIGKNRIDRAISILEKGHKATGDRSIKKMLDELIEERDGVSEPQPDVTTPPETTAEPPYVPTPTDRVQIDIYSFTEETFFILDFAMELAYPDFHERFFLNYILEGDDDVYVRKIENALESNNPPHIYVADARYARRFAVNRQTANLSDLGVNYNANDLYQYTLDYVTIGGNVKGLAHNANPGAMIYRSDLAKSIGLNDYNAVQAKMSTWDGFIDMARDLKRQGVYIVYGYDEIARPFLNARSSGWVNDNGQLYIDEATIKDFFNVSKQLYDIGAIANTGKGQWSGGWWEGMYGEIDVFAYFGCTWFLHYVSKGNSLFEYHNNSYQSYDDLIDAGMSDADIAALGYGTFGKWNITTPPVGYGYYWGGSYWFGSVAASQNEPVREGVAMIIETVTSNKEVMKAFTSGGHDNFYFRHPDFSNIKAVNEELSKDNRFNDPFLGGQNHYETFAKAADTITAKNLTIYDADFESFFRDAIYIYFIALDLGATPDQAYNTAMAEFVWLTSIHLPSINIPAEYNKFNAGAIDIPEEYLYDDYWW
ncbi:MAG: tetratricopeptide repeat protein, partial [Oscillospiraceae bacterium]|nr:tetratricopeptide repeat protein [Oscillospiraceae bacterium]